MEDDDDMGQFGYYFDQSIEEEFGGQGRPLSDVGDEQSNPFEEVAESLGVRLGLEIARGHHGRVFSGDMDMRKAKDMSDLINARSNLASSTTMMFNSAVFSEAGNNDDCQMQVCVKFLKPQQSERAQRQQQTNFQREVTLMRDLTSANVLIDNDNSCKLSDFGLAKIKDPLLEPSGQRGNLAWLAPETLHQSAFEPTSDVYSFGVILWEMQSRVVPFAGCSPAEIRRQKINGLWPPAHSVPVAENEGDSLLVNLMHQALQLNPDLRPKFGNIHESLIKQAR